VLKTMLLILSLSLVACGKIPEPPEVWQCAYSVKFNKFRCVNNKTKEAVNLSREDAGMEGAQCLTREGYLAMQKWIGELESLAEKRCK
jgi:hypothetical protein